MTGERSLLGKRAVVTGAASGIGAAIARALAEEGAFVTVADRDAEGAAAAATAVAGEAWVIDLAHTEALDELTLEADIVVNNAGIQHVSPIEDFDPDAFRRIHSIMLVAPFLLVRAALPHMYSRGWGRVINVSSVHGLRASEYKSAYVSAKHGLEGLSKVIALEGAERGVTSVCVNPGYVRTPLVTRQIAERARAHGIAEDDVLSEVMLRRSPIKRLVEPGEVASLVRWLVGPDAAMVSGTSYAMDGGWTSR